MFCIVGPGRPFHIMYVRQTRFRVECPRSHYLHVGMGDILTLVEVCTLVISFDLIVSRDFIGFELVQRLLTRHQINRFSRG